MTAIHMYTRASLQEMAQVFDDPSGRRARRLRRGSIWGAGALALLALLSALLLQQARWAAFGRDVPLPPTAHMLPFDRDAEVVSAWLDALAWKGRRAVFRVAGVDALRQPALLGRLVHEGHVVIAAPYSARATEGMPVERAELELAATQMALAGVLGREAVWADCGREDMATALAARLQDRGLRCAGLASMAQAGTQAQSPTAAALALTGTWSVAPPTLVQTADAALASGLLPAPVSHRSIARVLRGCLSGLDGLLQVAVAATLLLFAISLLRFCWIARAMLRRARTRIVQAAAAVDDASLPPVTVIVPAYNEEQVIVPTVRSLLACVYPHPVQVLIVDDGSRDGTLSVARAAFGGHPQVRVLTKPNGGKSSALNLGIEVADTPIVVCIDADTQLDPQALRLLCRHFDDPSVGAVAGNPKVGNRCNLLTRVQAMEYVVVDSVERQALEGYNAITCITGALGAYRRSLLLRLGGYVADTLAEDTDMTLRILASGARVAYEEDALAWTEAPETLRDFMKQRFRWMFGTVQAAFKHRDALFAVQRGSFGLIAMPNLLLLQVGAGCLLLPLVDMVGLLALSWLLFGSSVGWLFPHLGELLQQLHRYGLFFYMLIGATTLAAFVMAGVALRLDRRERLRSLLWLLPMQCALRVLLGITAYRCIGRSLSGRSLGWGTLKRTGRVDVLPPVAEGLS